MRAEVFDIAVSALSFHGSRVETPRIVQAARAVLVDGVRPGEAAIQYEFPPERVSEVVGRIRDKWAAICAERGLITETFSLSTRLVELLRQIELEGLQPLQADLSTRRRKKAPAAKTAEPASPLSEKPASAKPAAEQAVPVKSSAEKSTATKPVPVKQPLSKVAEKKPGKYKKPPAKK